MKLTHLEVKGLFNLFDYSIPLDNKENLTIITGPNGYGKTMLLNIIYNFLNDNRNYFSKLVYTTIIFSFDDGVKIKILNEEGLQLYKLYSDQSKWDTSGVFPKVCEIESAIKVHLIKEQRLLKVYKTDNEWFDRGVINKLVEVITECADELVNIIETTYQSSFSTSQNLDSSFPKRLLNEKESLTEEDFYNRFAELKGKQQKLKKYTLSESEQDIPEYNQTDARVLSVYLKDTEKKLSVFDDLLHKLDTFTGILNERRFSFKTIKISKERGFYFETSNGEPLQLTDLSSGEQHEVVLLFELIFLATPNTLVLIDEPELSLHVTWQREFLDDILKIISFQKMQVIVATHSPQIINDRWDLVYNLEKEPA